MFFLSKEMNAKMSKLRLQAKAKAASVKKTQAQDAKKGHDGPEKVS